jgi:hypothetical protein
MFKGRIRAKVSALPVLGTEKRNLCVALGRKSSDMVTTFKLFGTLDSKSDLFPIKTNGIPPAGSAPDCIKN